MRTLLALFLLGSALFAQTPRPSPTVAGGGGGTPGGSTLQVQYNNAAAFGGMAGTAWDDAAGVLDFKNSSSRIVQISTDPNGNSNDGFIFSTNLDGIAPPATSGASGNPGAEVVLTSIPGGTTSVATTGTGGRGGSGGLRSGAGGTAPSATTASTGGDSGDITILTGAGATAANAANVGTNVGGNSGSINLTLGAGGATSNGSSNTGGNGGSVNAALGSGGTGGTANGLDGTFSVLGGALANAPLQRWKSNGGTVLSSIGATGIPSFPSYLSNTNCSSGASPAVCVAAPAGSIVVAASATTVVVNTTVVTANSQILVTFDASLGTKLSVTCNATIPALYGVTARTAATSFTLTATAPVTNPACFSYMIVN